MLSVNYAECHELAFYAKCRYAESQYAECHGAMKLTGTSPTILQ
jgi:hypothetical protein